MSFLLLTIALEAILDHFLSQGNSRIMPFQVEPEALAEAGDRPGVGTPSRLLPWWRGRVGSGRGGFPGSSGTAAGAGWDGLRCAQLASETTKLLEMSPIGG